MYLPQISTHPIKKLMIPVCAGWNPQWLIESLKRLECGWMELGLNCKRGNTLSAAWPMFSGKTLLCWLECGCYPCDLHGLVPDSLDLAQSTTCLYLIRPLTVFSSLERLLPISLSSAHKMVPTRLNNPGSALIMTPTHPGTLSLAQLVALTHPASWACPKSILVQEWFHFTV